MIEQFRKKYVMISVVVPGLLLAGCAQTPLGPTVPVMPGAGKSFSTFQSDEAGCKDFAAGQVKGQADAANQRAVGAAVLSTVLGVGLGAATGSFGGVAGQGAGYGAASGSAVGALVGAQSSSIAQMGIQQQYDNAFEQCMYAKGNLVPGFTPPPGMAPPVATAPSPAVATADPTLVRGVQSELIRLDYLNEPADGAMGPQTRGAIRDYQQAQGLSVDGQASKELLARLQSTPSHAAVVATDPKPWVSPSSSGSGSAPAATPAVSGAAAPPAGAAPNWVTPPKSD